MESEPEPCCAQKLALLRVPGAEVRGCLQLSLTRCRASPAAPPCPLSSPCSQVRRAVEDCIKNIHPIYHIKTLMIKRELAKDPTLATENWDRFLPNFKKKNVKRKAVAIKPKAPYTPFPPAQPLSRVDQMLESGEYFLTKDQQAARARVAKSAAQAGKTEERKRQREAEFVAPREERGAGKRDAPEAPPREEAAAAELAKSLKKKLKTRKM